MKIVNLPTPKAILFDFDNTLVDVWPIMHSCINHTFKEMKGSSWRVDQVQISMERSLRDYFPKIFGNEWEKAQDLYRECYIANSKNLAPLPNAEGMLQFLKSKGMYSAIVSNKTGFILRDEISLLQWDKYFTSIVGATDTSEDKPSIVPVKKAIEEADSNLTEEVWFIGDTLTDMECARNSGCSAVLFGENPNKEIFIRSAPDLHVKNHSELLEVLKKLL